MLSEGESVLQVAAFTEMNVESLYSSLFLTGGLMLLIYFSLNEQGFSRHCWRKKIQEFAYPAISTIL